MKFITSLIFTLLPLAAVFSASELPKQVTINKEVPEWVEPIEAQIDKENPEDRNSDGVYYLLSDQQAHTKDKTIYKHFALRLTTADGVEDYSSIAPSIDPDTQELTWHRLDIIRDGVRMDQLPIQEFRASTNQSSDNLIYDNTLECLAIIKGTRKGDILDYAYSIRGGNPITGGRFSRWFSLDYSVPIAHIFARVVRFADERPLATKLISPAPIEIDAPQALAKNGTVEYRFERKDVAPIHTDDNLPYDYLAYSYCVFSDWKSWGEVSDWGRKLYHYKDTEVTLPADLAKQLAQWQLLEDPKAQALAALDWVQEEIRYVGIMIGPHNYKPYTIDQTLARSFGDCKDKTQLLCYLLNKMGIEAYPTLVNTADLGLIKDYLPSPSSFDHVITTVIIDGATYWLDPTNSGQAGPIDTIWLPNYQYGLNLVENTEDLVEVTGQGADVSKTLTRETFAMSEYNGAIELSVYTRYEGAEADSQRRIFERTNAAENEKDFLNFYAQSYPNISIREPLRHSDNTEQNIFEVYESYTLTDEWIVDENNEAVSYFYTYPEIIRSWTFLSDTRIRTMPAAQNFPMDQTQIIEIVLPEPGDFEDERSEIKTPWFHFKKDISTDESKLIIKHHYKHLTPQIEAESYPEYTRKVDDLLDLLGYSITYTDGSKQTENGNNSASQPYVATYLSLILATVLGFLAVYWIGSRKKNPPKPPINQELDGISGWLILVAIGVVATPLTFITGLGSQTDYFNSEWVLPYIESDTVFYTLSFELLLLSEVAFNTFYLVISFVLIYTFFKKRAIFRVTYVVFASSSILYVGLSTVIQNHLLVNTGYDPLEADYSLIGDTIRTLIWSSYLFISDRARSTFRH